MRSWLLFHNALPQNCVKELDTQKSNLNYNENWGVYHNKQKQVKGQMQQLAIVNIYM